MTGMHRVPGICHCGKPAEPKWFPFCSKVCHDFWTRKKEK